MAKNEIEVTPTVAILKRDFVEKINSLIEEYIELPDNCTGYSIDVKPYHASIVALSVPKPKKKEQ